MPDEPTTQSGPADWDFPTLALLWDAVSGTIIAGADRLEALDEAQRARSLAALGERVSSQARELDDGWLVATAFFMIEDLYKSYCHQFRWTPGVHAYIAATAVTLMDELTRRGFVLHYVIDNTESEANLAEILTYLPAVFKAAGLLVTGPQLMALELLERVDHRAKDVTAIQLYRDHGHHVADRVIERCHRERLSSVYLNMDLDDDSPALALDVALSQANMPGTIVVYRTESPSVGSRAHIAPPPGVALPQ